MGGFRGTDPYRIVGQQDRGWLHKCGYELPEADAALSHATRRLLRDLSVLCATFDLIAVGLSPKDKSWKTLNTLTALAKGSCGWRKVDDVHLRVYAPEDYQDRLCEILGPPTKVTTPFRRAALRCRKSASPDALAELPVEQLVLFAGISNKTLAEHLNVTPAFVSQLMNRSKPWPPARERVARQMAMRVIATRRA